MPFGHDCEFETFADCVAAMRRGGRSEESARNICGTLQRDTEEHCKVKARKMSQTLNFSLEIKALGEREFEGHGSIFRNTDLGGDIVVPGAFRRTLAEHRKAGTMPLMFWMHNPSEVPGVWKEMGEDDEGLHVQGELVDTQLGNEMRTLLQKKAVRGLSIGYLPTEVDFDKDGNRLLKAVDLWEVSIVSLAMNPLARVDAVKSRLSHEGEYVPGPRELETMLRKAGFSQSIAKRLISAMRAGGVLDDAGIRDVDRPRDVDDVESGEVAEAAQELLARMCAGFNRWKPTP